MNHKGQVTIFIIIGILLIILISIGSYYRNELFNLVTPLDEIRVPIEAREFYDYVTYCTEEVSKDGLVILGQQGGYINLPSGPPPNIVNPFSNKLNVVGGLETSYWYYEKSSARFENQVPTIALMQAELSAYINNNLDSCLDDFEIFTGYQIETKDRKVGVSIRAQDILVTLDYPIHVVKDNFEYDFTQFKKVIDLDLRSMFDQAVSILNYQLENQYFEDKTLGMLITYDEIPYSGLEESCAPIVWSRAEVRAELQNIVSRNIQFYKVKGTNYELFQEENSAFEIEIPVEDSGFDVNFNHFTSWPFFMEVEPAEGDLMISQSITKDLGPAAGFVQGIFCMNEYHFVYDLRYPILVSITKPNAFQGSGYTFQYAFITNIKRNQPGGADVIIPEQLFEPDIKYCNAKTQTVTIYTYGDELNDQLKPLGDVNVQYKCINHGCDVGQSKLTEFGGEITGNVPLCWNGFIVANKVGYHQSQTLFSTTDETVTSVFLKPYTQKSFEVYVDRSKTTGVSGGLNEDESVVIQLINQDDDFSAFATAPNDNIITLIPGTYEGKVYLMSSSKQVINIPEHDVESCYDKAKPGLLGFLGQTEKECFTTTIPSVSLDKAIIGQNSFNITILNEDLRRIKLNFMFKHYRFQIPWKRCRIII